jgi:hypothetical protein
MCIRDSIYVDPLRFACFEAVNNLFMLSRSET